MGTVSGLAVAGARLPDHVKIGLSSRIGDDVVAVHAGEEVGDAYTIMAGVVAQHLAISNVPIISVQWVVPPGGAPIYNYVINPNSGVAYPLPPSLTMNPLYFAWTAPCATYVGVYITTAYGTGYVENYFYVQTPTVQSFTSVTDAPYAGPFAGSTYLRFGQPPGPGITIQATVACPGNVSGRFAFLQLASNARVGTDTDGVSWRWNLNGMNVLDVGPGPQPWLFYQNAFLRLGEGQSGQFDITDAPAAELGPPFRLVSVGDGEPIVPETYQTYLMFQPNVSGSIWIALQMLTWWWEGYSELDAGAWSAVQQPANSPNPGGQPQTALPTWNANTMDGDWVVGVRSGGGMRERRAPLAGAAGEPNAAG